MIMQSVLVEYEDSIEGKVYANSGCLISNKYVIITANILVNLITTQTGVKTKINSLPPGFSSPDKLLTSKPKLNVVTNSENPYICKSAKVVAIYVSDCIREQTKRFFNDWSFDEENSAQQLKEILSLFFVLEVDNQLPQTNSNTLINCLYEVCLESGEHEIKAGDKVVIQGTPFGNRSFLRSQSRGIVSNIFGNEKCFILTDTPTSPGCEGGPIYLKKKKDIFPIGIVLVSLAWWKGEWIGLTLCATFTGIFSTVLQKPTQIVRNRQRAELNAVHDAMHYSFVQVISGTAWGSGILLDKENGIFVTNSHVVETDFPILIWQNVEIKSHVLYKTSPSEVYDIAVLIADLNHLQKSNMRAISVSNSNIFFGETVFAVGFPLFPKTLKPQPTITKGHISHIAPYMIKTTCTVLSGSSGGGILRKNGELIGIIVCNARIEDNLSIIPRVNMAIPITNIIDIISNYARTKDTAILQELKTENLLVQRGWNFLSSNL